MSKKLRRLLRRKITIKHLPNPKQEERVFAAMDDSPAHASVRCEYCGKLGDIKFGKCQNFDCQVKRVKALFRIRPKPGA